MTNVFIRKYVHVQLCFGVRPGFGAKLQEKVTFGWVLQT